MREVGEGRGGGDGEGRGYARNGRNKSGATPERMKEALDTVINRSGDMALESKEEEEWERKLRKAEANMNLNLNTPPQAGKIEEDGIKEDEVVKVNIQGEPVTDRSIGVNKRAYSSHFFMSSGRGVGGTPQGEKAGGSALDQPP